MKRIATKGAGFTLIEVLISMAIFAVISVLAYGALSQTLDSAEWLGARMQRLQQVQKTMRFLSNDFTQLAPRPIRQEFGDSFGAALTSGSDIRSPYLIEISHGGWSNPAALPRGTVQRSAYFLDEDELVRVYWPALDRSANSEGVEVTLVNDVESFAVRYLTSESEWSEQWPPEALAGPAALRLRPRAVEVTITLADYGEIRRLLEVAP